MLASAQPRLKFAVCFAINIWSDSCELAKQHPQEAIGEYKAKAR
jgi:hypothetical protein